MTNCAYYQLFFFLSCFRRLRSQKWQNTAGIGSARARKNFYRIFLPRLGRAYRLCIKAIARFMIAVHARVCTRACVCVHVCMRMHVHSCIFIGVKILFAESWQFSPPPRRAARRYAPNLYQPIERAVIGGLPIRALSADDSK